VGRDGNAVAEAYRQAQGAFFRGYARLSGAVPVLHAPGSGERASKVRDSVGSGIAALSNLLGLEAPALVALLVADGDWPEAPRGSARPYPKGLPYFTRAVSPPALVLPEELSPVFRPRTAATYPLAVWHELAHAFVLEGREVVVTPAWLREWVPQAASAAVARQVGLPLDEHLGLVDRKPGFTVRGLAGYAGAEEQMAFQNLLLILGDAALSEFGEGFLGRLVRAVWDETEPVGEGRAEELLAEALGTGGPGWLASRGEF
jgi:hypothetical protein